MAENNGNGNAANVTAAKPKVGGAVWRAPVGTPLPTDAATPLDAAFKSMGYISEDGFTNAQTTETSQEKDWGGDVVNTMQTGTTDTFKTKYIESLKLEVLKDVFGDENVDGDLDKGITIRKNSKEKENHSYVADMILKHGVLKRIVIPAAKITDMGDIVHKAKESTGYDVTMTAETDDAGQTHYEYIKKGNSEK